MVPVGHLKKLQPNTAADGLGLDVFLAHNGENLVQAPFFEAIFKRPGARLARVALAPKGASQVPADLDAGVLGQRLQDHGAHHLPIIFPLDGPESESGRIILASLETLGHPLPCFLHRL